MSRLAWTYIGVTLVAAAAIAAQAVGELAGGELPWRLTMLFMVLATLAQLFEVKAPSRQSFYPAMAFFFAAVLLLPPALTYGVVAVAHLVEEIKGRLIDRRRRPFYIQLFNVATHILASGAAGLVYHLIAGSGALLDGPRSVVGVALAAFIYILVNHSLIGQVLLLARSISWKESGLLEADSLLSDLILSTVGGVIAVIWLVNPWMVVIVLMPMVLMYRALAVPMLRQEAQTDPKTGLANVYHLRRVLEANVGRAQSLRRPLAVIMADLDFLRTINNTYGHLAGDIVIGGIGRIINASKRQEDTASRFGGEEFVIVLPDTSETEAAMFAERIRAAVAEAHFALPTHPEPINVTVSIGVAMLTPDMSEFDQLLHAADLAVYAAKHAGRNRIIRASTLASEVLRPAGMATPASYKTA